MITLQNSLLNMIAISNAYILFVGLLYLLIRIFMNNMEIKQSHIYKLWQLFPLGFIFLYVFSLYKSSLISPVSLPLMSLNNITAMSGNYDNNVQWLSISLSVWAIIAIYFLTTLLLKYIKLKGVLENNSIAINKNVFQTNMIVSPIAFGVFKPVVYLPQNIKYNKTQKSLLINHEIIHCQRYDPLFRLLYKILVGIFWFNPVIYLLNKNLKIDQELSCDEKVIGVTKKKAEYSKLLLQLNLSSCFDKNPSELYCSSTSKLKERIMLIKNFKAQEHSIRNKILLPLVMLIASGGLIITTNVLAEMKTEKAAVATAPMVPEPPKSTIVPSVTKNTAIAPVVSKNLGEIKIIPIKRVAPLYPRKAAMNKVTGFVVVDLEIMTDGSVDNVRVVESDPKEVFDIQAINSVEQYKFAPISQVVTIRQRVNFKLD